jgi:hypothetical protein
LLSLIQIYKMGGKRNEGKEEERQEENVIKHVLSYGAGVNSTALLIFLIKNNYPLDLVLFSDTGGEFPHTYETIKYYKEYCESKNIRFEIVKSKLSDSLYSYLWNKKIVPSIMRRDCTAKFKIRPMRKFMRETYGKKTKFIQYIGIDYGESHRVMTNDVKYIQNKYPLVDNKINREKCEEILRSEGLLIPKKSGCYFCMFTKRQNWINLLNEDPELFNKAMKLEQNTERYPERAGLLHSIPLLKIKNRETENTKLEDFEPICDVSGSCFL